MEPQMEVWEVLCDKVSLTAYITGAFMFFLPKLVDYIGEDRILERIAMTLVASELSTSYLRHRVHLGSGPCFSGPYFLIRIGGC